MKMDRTADHDHGGRGFNAILNTHPSLVQESPEGYTPGLVIFVPALACRDYRSLGPLFWCSEFVELAELSLREILCGTAGTYFRSTVFFARDVRALSAPFLKCCGFFGLRARIRESGGKTYKNNSCKLVSEKELHKNFHNRREDN